MERLRWVVPVSLLLCSVAAAAQDPLPGVEAAPAKAAEVAPKVDAAPAKAEPPAKGKAAKGKAAKGAKGAAKAEAAPAAAAAKPAADARPDAAPRADAAPAADAAKTAAPPKADAPAAKPEAAPAKAEFAPPAAAAPAPAPAPAPPASAGTPWWAEELKPGFKLTVGLSGGMTVLNLVGFGTYYPDTHNFETWDREYKRSFGLDVEVGWRFGAVSLGVQGKVFFAGSPAVFNRELLVPVTVGPRLEVAVGLVRLGAAGVLALNPKSPFLGMDGGFNADVGVQLGHFGVRLTSGVLFGGGTYPTAEAQTLLSTHSTSLVPIHLSVLWDY